MDSDPVGIVDCDPFGRERTLRTMRIHLAILPTPSESAQPNQLIFYKHFAPVTQLNATLTRLPASGHLTVHSTLPSIFRILFQVPYPVSPVFATLTNTAGCAPTNPIPELIFVPISLSPCPATSLLPETAAPFPQRWGLLRKGRAVFRREDRDFCSAVKGTGSEISCPREATVARRARP
jgi:hypothetical protein